METLRIALIPAYKPDSRLAEMAEKLSERGFAAVVVNDGSGSEFDTIFNSTRQHAQVLSHGVNKGKGAALKTGLQYIRDTYAPPYTVVTLDADGQHSLGDAERVCLAASEDMSALVLGTRDFKGNVPMRSLVGNSITRAVFRVTSGRSVSDTQTGLRAFSHRHTDRMLAIAGDRYEYEMNVLMEYARAELPMIELPIETIYISGNASSHFDTLHDSCRIYREILKFSASSLICFGLDYVLYCLFTLVSGSVAAANVLARVFSSVTNYALNRRLVFNSKDPVKRSAVQYFALAAFILLFNTLLLRFLVDKTPLDRYAAKILTECVMFVFSWTVQKTVIFRQPAEKKSRS